MHFIILYIMLYIMNNPKSIFNQEKLKNNSKHATARNKIYKKNCHTSNEIDKELK